MIVKRKLYSVMDEEGNLGYYLYNESTGEEKLFTKRDLIDEDFLEEQEERKKNDRRSAKILVPIAGGMLGATLGVAGGGKGALIGTAAGAGLGYLGGKKLAKASDKKYDKLLERYKSAKTKEEKAYLRHKMEKEMDRRNISSSAAMAGSLAGRRW
jgi:uncharacterized protein YcfJ